MSESSRLIMIGPHALKLGHEDLLAFEFQYPSRKHFYLLTVVFSSVKLPLFLAKFQKVSKLKELLEFLRTISP